jgi:hypothetical protein
MGLSKRRTHGAASRYIWRSRRGLALGGASPHPPPSRSYSGPADGQTQFSGRFSVSCGATNTILKPYFQVTTARCCTSAYGKFVLVPESMEFRDAKETGISATPGRPGRKVARPRPEPSADALGLLRSLVRRSQRSTGVPLAQAFIRRANADDSPPPLTRLMRGGQGGEVRLKLYLTMSLLAVRAPFDLPAIPARSWAEALDLPDPERNGARRVSDAIDWLAENKLIVAERRQGAPSPIRLLSQDGLGKPYVRPTPAGRYVRLGLGLWYHGWIVRLSGTALAILAVLLDLQGGRAQPQWISPTQARRRYDLSPDTWTKGLKELEGLGLVTVTRKAQGDFFDYRRMRNAYWVNEHELGAPEQALGTRRGRTRTRPR